VTRLELAGHQVPSALGRDCPKRRSDVSARVVEGETVVLDRHASLVHQLNVTASFVWDRCDGRCTVPDIAEQLAAAFGTDPDASNEAVAAALRRFAELGLLEPARA
jgi:hypothetical protein